MHDDTPPEIDRRAAILRRQGAALAIGIVLLVLPFAAKAIGQSALVPLMTRVLIYAIAAASLNLILGFGGMVSFGQAAFFGIGGYVVGILAKTYASGSLLLGFIPGSNDLLVVAATAMIVAGIAALLIGALCLRTSGVQFIMITLAFAQMVYFLFVSLKTYGGDDGLSLRRRDVFFGFDVRDEATFYFICLAAAAVLFAALWRIVGSRFGMVLAGIRQSERRMAAIGISPYGYKLVAFVLSGMGAGLAGALMANDLRFVSPDMLHWSRSGEFLIMVILGGVGTLWGPLLGAAAFAILEASLTSWTEHWPLALGTILLLVVLFAKGGLAGLLKGVAR